MWSGLGFIPFAMATPSMRHIFLQAFQSFKIAFSLLSGGGCSAMAPARLIRFQYLNTKIMLKM